MHHSIYKSFFISKVMLLNFLMPSAVLFAADGAAVCTEVKKAELSSRNGSASERKCKAMSTKSKAIVERLRPGDDFQQSLKRIASEHELKAGVVVSAVGSFKTACMRFAGADAATEIQGPLEVVSATGTISESSMHVHISVSDSSGKTFGGHLMPGCKVFTTIELVILDLSDEWSFERKMDEQTTYLELAPAKNTK